MGPEDRKAALEWFRTVFDDESGRLDIGKMVDSLKRFRRRFPMEEEVRKQRPNSPVISETERWNTGMADGIKAVVDQPWWKPIRTGSAEAMKDAEQAAVNEWKAAGSTPQAALRARRHFSPEVQAAMRHRDLAFDLENASRRYFGLPEIPRQPGPYLPRRTDAEMREAVSLGGGTLGVGRGQGLQTTVRGHGKERVFETYRQGEAAGTVYEDPPEHDPHPRVGRTQAPGHAPAVSEPRSQGHALS